MQIRCVNVHHDPVTFWRTEWRTGWRKGSNVRKKTTAAKLHLLTSREVQTAGEGDHTDGGGLLLRVRAQSASWVLRFTATTGRRREMGLGVARRGSAAQTGNSLSGARELAHEARELLKRGLDPIDERDRRRNADKAAWHAKKATKAHEGMTLSQGPGIPRARGRAPADCKTLGAVDQLPRAPCARRDVAQSDCRHRRARTACGPVWRPRAG